MTGGRMLLDLLPERFRKNTTSFSNCLAVTDQTGTWTYAELMNSISYLSAVLKAKGVTYGPRVVVMVDNSAAYIATFYALWSVGAIVVAINAKATKTEAVNVVRQSGALLVVGDAKSCLAMLHAEIPEHQRLLLEDIPKSGSDIPPLEWHMSKPDDIAQIIFTSGTTGNPKGVSLSHYNLAVNTWDIVRYLELTEADSIVNVLPFHFSYGNSVMHTHLYVGAHLILGYSMAYPQYVVDALRKEKASGFSGVPTTFRALMKMTDWANSPPPLRYITQAGGAMGVSLTEQLLNSCDHGTQIFVMYGQTEASARISWLPPADLLRKIGSAGLALEHLSISIRDEQGNEVSAGQVGEIYVRGDNIMQGYWNNDVETKRVLSTHGLKTGDLGYVDVDGYLFITGRQSEMIKVAENRIHPLEIEEVVCQLDFVLEAAVVGVPDDDYGQKLVLYVVGEASTEHSMAIKRYCSSNLSKYKIPKQIHWISELPKTPSGKIQRFKLLTQ